MKKVFFSFFFNFIFFSLSADMTWLPSLELPKDSVIEISLTTSWTAFFPHDSSHSTVEKSSNLRSRWSGMSYEVLDKKNLFIYLQKVCFNFPTKPRTISRFPDSTARSQSSHRGASVILRWHSERLSIRIHSPGRKLVVTTGDITAQLPLKAARKYSSRRTQSSWGGSAFWQLCWSR
jgi:hypothetical protein